MNSAFSSGVRLAQRPRRRSRILAFSSGVRLAQRSCRRFRVWSISSGVRVAKCCRSRAALAARRSGSIRISARLALCWDFFSRGCAALRCRSAAARLSICLRSRGDGSCRLPVIGGEEYLEPDARTDRRYLESLLPETPRRPDVSYNPARTYHIIRPDGRAHARHFDSAAEGALACRRRSLGNTRRAPRPNRTGRSAPLSQRFAAGLGEAPRSAPARSAPRLRPRLVAERGADRG